MNGFLRNIFALVISFAWGLLTGASAPEMGLCFLAINILIGVAQIEQQLREGS